MLQVDEPILILVFVCIGLSTFFFRAIFLYYIPSRIQTNQTIRRGIESVPGSLLVALVIPYTLFIDGIFSPWRIEVVSILLAVPVLYYIKKPGLSLLVAIAIFFILNAV